MKLLLFLQISLLTIQSYTKKFENEIDYDLIDEILKETINEKIDPCDDFNEFACGKWLNKQDLTYQDSYYRTSEAYQKLREIFYDKYMCGRISYNSTTLDTLKFAFKKCITFNLYNFQKMPVEIAYKICKNDTNLVSLYLFQFIAMKEIIGMDKMNKIKNDITILYSNLKETFEEIIKDKKWLDEETKNRIIKKLNSIEFFIPIPEKLDILEVDWEYKFLKIHPDHKYPVIKEILEYFFTLFDYNEYILARALYIQPNAGYNYLFNFIMASLGLLLEPVYGTKFMASLKFGGYGSILAHEILHGYSGRSLKYTEKFNFNDLLTDYSLKNYIKKAECIVNQYDNKTYKDSDFKASGLYTHTENISDNSGIKLAFIAYKKYVEKYGYEKNKMRTFGKYTNDQLFYISWAQYMCEIYKPSKVEYLFFEDSHLPGEMRIENTLKNQEGFAKAFNCKEGSKMNPKDKCEVWRYRKN